MEYVCMCALKVDAVQVLQSNISRWKKGAHSSVLMRPGGNAVKECAGCCLHVHAYINPAP